MKKHKLQVQAPYLGGASLKEKQKMKKQLAISSLAAAVAILGASSAHAFQSQQKQALTAQATTGGTLSSNFTATLLNTNNTAAGTTINWTGALPGGGWKIADQMIRLNWNVTDAGGGIQVYTDNKNAAANPMFVDPTPGTPAVPPATATAGNNQDSNPAGLLLVPTTGVNSSVALPLAWSIKDTAKTVGGTDPATGIQPADPNNGLLTGPANKWQWLYMLDKNTPYIDRNGDGDLGDTTATVNPDTAAFPNPTGPFVQMIKGPGSVTGIHFAQGDTDFGSDPDKSSYVYLQADFTNAAAQQTYRTNQLTIEAFIQ